MLLRCSCIIAHMWSPPFCFGRSNAVFMLLLCSRIIAHMWPPPFMISWSWSRDQVFDLVIKWLISWSMLWLVNVSHLILMLVPDWLHLSRGYNHYIIAHMRAKLVLIIKIVSQLTIWPIDHMTTTTWPQPLDHNHTTTTTTTRPLDHNHDHLTTTTRPLDHNHNHTTTWSQPQPQPLDHNNHTTTWPQPQPLDQNHLITWPQPRPLDHNHLTIWPLDHMTTWPQLLPIISPLYKVASQ